MNKLKLDDEREIRRSASNPLLLESLRGHSHNMQNNGIPKPLTWPVFIYSIKKPANIFLLVSLFSTYLISNFCSVYVFYSMSYQNPRNLHRALPDVISDAWPSFALLRSMQRKCFPDDTPPVFSSSWFIALISTYISSFITLILVSLTIYFTLIYYSAANIKKCVLIFIVSMLFRTLFAMVTQLPPPCAGFANCKCSEFIIKIEYLKLTIENKCADNKELANRNNSLSTNRTFHDNIISSIQNSINKEENDLSAATSNQFPRIQAFMNYRSPLSSERSNHSLKIDPALNFEYQSIFNTNLSFLLNHEQTDICNNPLLYMKSPFSIALTNMLTFGIGRTGNVPRCGGLMVSGRAIFQCCIGHSFIELMEKVVTYYKYRAVLVFVIVLMTTSFINSILIRDEYTISVTISIFFVELMYKLYNCALFMSKSGYGPFLTSKIGFLFRLLDNDNL